MLKTRISGLIFFDLELSPVHFELKKLRKAIEFLEILRL
jgi:hypothetical protein